MALRWMIGDNSWRKFTVMGYRTMIILYNYTTIFPQECYTRGTRDINPSAVDRPASRAHCVGQGRKIMVIKSPRVASWDDNSSTPKSSFRRTYPQNPCNWFIRPSILRVRYTRQAIALVTITVGVERTTLSCGWTCGVRISVKRMRLKTRTIL